MKQIGKENKVKHGKRGRPALSPALKAHKEALKAEAKARSGGKRGRPKSAIPKTVSTPKVGGKRGRPPLTPEALAKKTAAKTALQKRSGGKRGRPKLRR